MQEGTGKTTQVSKETVSKLEEYRRARAAELAAKKEAREARAKAKDLRASVDLSGLKGEALKRVKTIEGEVATAHGKLAEALKVADAQQTAYSELRAALNAEVTQLKKDGLLPTDLNVKLPRTAVTVKVGGKDVGIRVVHVERDAQP